MGTAKAVELSGRGSLSTRMSSLRDHFLHPQEWAKRKNKGTLRLGTQQVNRAGRKGGRSSAYQRIYGRVLRSLLYNRVRKKKGLSKGQAHLQGHIAARGITKGKEPSEKNKKILKAGSSPAAVGPVQSRNHLLTSSRGGHNSK